MSVIILLFSVRHVSFNNEMLDFDHLILIDLKKIID